MSASKYDPIDDLEQRLRTWFNDVEEPPPPALAAAVQARTDRLGQRRHLAWRPFRDVGPRRALLVAATAAAVALAAIVPLSGIGRWPSPPTGSPLCGPGSPLGPDVPLDGVWSRSGSTALVQQVDDEVWLLDVSDTGNTGSMTILRGTRSGAAIEGSLVDLYSTDALADGPVVTRLGTTPSSPAGQEPGLRMEIVSAPDGFSREAWTPVCPSPGHGGAAAGVRLPAVVDDRPIGRNSAAACMRRDEPTGAFWPMWRSEAHEVVYVRQIGSTWWLAAWSGVASNEVRPSVLVLAAEGQIDPLPARWVDLVAGRSGVSHLVITAAGLRVDDSVGRSGLGSLEACEFE